MSGTSLKSNQKTTIRLGLWVIFAIALAIPYANVSRLAAQNPENPASQERDLDAEADRAAANAEQQQQEAAQKKSAPSAKADEPTMNLLDLGLAGGILMIPIAILSIVVVLIAFERALALRASRVMPEGLVASLGQLAARQEAFDPRAAYRVCQQFPSAAASVIRAMLLKVGRPHAEVERAVSEASDREATVLYDNVRWLTMAAAVGPLLGLLGTVQGMIQAFYVTSKAEVGQNKATMLAEGIYTALVTTFAGLCVAIPAVMIAHYFEGRIQGLFRRIEDLVGTLLPHVERYEGRMRTNAKALDGEDRPVEATLVEKGRG
jgi:biopolymer transport protein ExbB